MKKITFKIKEIKECKGEVKVESITMRSANTSQCR